MQPSYFSKTLWGGAYRKFPKYSNTQKICSNHPKIWNDADGMANIVDPDQTAPLEESDLGIRLLLQEQSDLGLHCLPRHICPKT